MKCPVCGGIGLTDLHTPNVGRCTKCNGSGEIEPTNEEWFCALPTKDKAKFLEAQQKHGGTIASRSDVDWEVWLKEKHEESE